MTKIFGLFNRFNTSLNPMKRKSVQGSFKMMPVLDKDTFQKKNSLPKLEILEGHDDSYNGKVYQEIIKLCDIQHKKRMQKYGSNIPLKEPEKATKDKYRAVFWIQEGLEGYNDVQNKLKNKLPLNKKEQQYFNFILNQMKPSKEDRTLWRLVIPYDGFREQIHSGHLNLNLLNF